MPKTILAVDDSESVRQMVSLTLSEAGYEVIQAKDGQDALRKLKTSIVDMIITDYYMPNMNGIEVLREVRWSDSSHKFVPIIMLTTKYNDSKKEQGREAGASGWIVKPFKPENLISVVKKVLG